VAAGGGLMSGPRRLIRGEGVDVWAELAVARGEERIDTWGPSVSVAHWLTGGARGINEF
jgi:hypothetical protein